MIKSTITHHHWNYFFALDSDLEKVSRFIEFADLNMGTYSIELTHILLSACSETDVVLRQACEALAEINSVKTKVENMEDYRTIFMDSGFKHIANETIHIPRFGLNYNPWENWLDNKNPDWWRLHNKVKHERHLYFEQANVKNTINAVGGLLLSIAFYYQILSKKEHGNIPSIEDITFAVQRDKTTFLQLDPRHYKNRYLTMDEIDRQLKIREIRRNRVK